MQALSHLLKVALLMFLGNYFLIDPAHAQLNAYTFSQSVTGFAQSSHGSELGTSANAGLRTFLDPMHPEGSMTATYGPGIPIGFNFVYNGIVYDRFGVVNSGWICLGRSAYGDHAVDVGPLQYQPLERLGPANDTLRSRIVGLDANLVGNSSSSSLTYELSGDSAAQVLVVKWKKYQLFQSSGSNNTIINFEIRLNQADHSIDIRYGEMYVATYTSLTNSNIGLGGKNVSDFNNRKTLATKNWNTTIAGTLGTDDCVLQSTSVPPEFGRNFHWTPVACFEISTIQVDALTNTTCSLSWSPSEIVEDPQFEYAFNTTPAAPATGSIISDSSVNFSNLLPNTLYYLHIRVICSPGVYSPWHTQGVRTLCDASLPPYYQNFDSTPAPNLPSCFSRINVNPVTQTWITDDESGLSAPNALIIPYEPILNNDDWLFLPGLELEQDTTYIIRLDYFSYRTDSLFLYAGPYPAIDSMSFVDTFSVPDDYQFKENFTFYIPELTGICYFALHSMSADLRVDNIGIEKYACTPPEDIQLVTNELSNVLLEWTSTTVSTSFQYGISQSANYPPGTLQIINGEDIQFTTLESGKNYYFFLRASCGGDSYSPWQTFRFETKSGYDECTDAILLIPEGTADCDMNTYRTIGASNSGLIDTTCSGYADDDVWFKFVATKRSHGITLNNLCFGGGGGGGSLLPDEHDTRVSMPDLCQPLILEIRAINCADSLIACIEIPTGLTRKLNAVSLIPDSMYYIRVYGKDTVVQGQTFGMCIGTYPTETNNDCASAILLPVSTTTCPTNNTKDIAGASSATTPLSECDTAPYFDLWYKFVTTSSSHIIEATFQDNGNGVMDIFDNPCSGTVALACADSTMTGSEQITISGLTIGDTIYIRVYDANNIGQQMRVSMCIRIPLANDDCSNATEITTVSGITFSNPMNANSFNSTGSGTCNGYYADDDVWYRFTAVNDTHMISVIPIAPSAMATPVVELFDGDCDSASLSCSNTGDLLMAFLIPGQEYYLRVYSSVYLTGRGNFRVGVTIPPPNVLCENASPIAVNDTIECLNITEGSMIGTGVENEIWFSFIATQTSHIIREFDGNSSISLYADCANTFLGTSGSGGIYYRNFIPGNTYYIRVANNVFAAQNYQYYQFPVSFCITTTAANDECAGALPIIPDSICSNLYYGNTSASTPSVTAGTCFPNKADAWYTFTATSRVHEVEIKKSFWSQPLFGEIYKGSCPGEPIHCFSTSLGYPDPIASLDIFEPDSTYLIRIGDKSSLLAYDTFSVCVGERPVNDYCHNATSLEHGSTNSCRKSLYGTTINASMSLGHKNVWYKVAAQSNEMTIMVTPITDGFDPAIKLWTTEGGIFFEDCVFSPKITLDDTHAPFQTEALVINELIPGQTYYIEVYDGMASAQSGDFEICMFQSGRTMTVLSSIYETYPFDTVVTAGTWNQPVVRVTLEMSGVDYHKALRQIRFNLAGTTDTADIRRASVYIDPQINAGSNSGQYPYLPFGESGEGFGRNPPPVLFGTPIDNPGNILEFSGDYYFIGELNSSILGSQTFPRFIYLLLEINCDADPGHIIHAICESLQVDDQGFSPLPYQVHPLPIAPLDRYDTRANGNWNDGDVWVCESPPPMNADNPKVNIYHDIVITDTVVTGSMKIHYLQSLAVLGSALTLGGSSAGPATGLSDKLLDCTEGTFILDEANVSVNGGYIFGDFGGELSGNGICCNYGQGSYKLMHGDSVLTRDSNYVSVDYHSFRIQDGVVVQNLNAPIPGRNETKENESHAIALFSKNTGRADFSIPAEVRNYSLLSLNKNIAADLMRFPKARIILDLPLTHTASLPVELEWIKKPNEHTIYRTAPEMELFEAPSQILYQGKVSNEERSIVTMAVSAEGITMIVSSSRHPNLTLTKINGSETYIAYNDQHMAAQFSFTCQTSEEGLPYTQEQLEYSSGTRGQGDCIYMFIEVDHDIVLDKGGAGGGAMYINTLMNQVTALYMAENISIAISEMLLWTSPSPYVNGSSLSLLQQFGTTRPIFNGDVAMLLSYKSEGGVAYMNGLCSPLQTNSQSFSKIESTYQNYPVYSFPVYVIAHELGHLLGARHTHACVWNGDHTAIDGCYTSEGPCVSEEIPASGGTIMSYCHLTEVGINFSEGFGPQPGNVLRYAVDQAACTQSCASTSCTETAIQLILKTDQRPEEIFWELKDSLGQTLYFGGPYIIENNLYQKTFCLPDGWYGFLIRDSYNYYPGGSFVGVNSQMTLDGNDGQNDPDDALFRISNTNFYTDNLDVRFSDPGDFIIGTQHGLNTRFNGTVTIGGGDDTGAATRFFLRTMGINAYSLTLLDSIIVEGGMAADGRHLVCGASFVGCNNAWVKPGAELSGGLAITGNLINDGLVTSDGRILSFCGDIQFFGHLTNTSNSQTLSGEGLFRTDFNSPIPATQADNQLRMLRVDNSYSGLNLDMPLGIKNILRLRYGNINNDMNSLVTLGDSTHSGVLLSFTDESFWFTETPYTGDPMYWDGGFVNGPFRRWFMDSTVGQEVILPIGKGDLYRTVALSFEQTDTGYVTAEYFPEDPGNDGMPLYNEQATNIMRSSPTGYWTLEGNNTSGQYDLMADASYFKIDGVHTIQDVSQARLIKRPSGGLWANSESTTTTGSTDLRHMRTENLSSFSDFGVGMKCTNIVSTAIDTAYGSLQYIIDHCVSNGDTVKFDTALSLLTFPSGSVIIDKNITIYSSPEDNIILKGIGSHSLIDIGINNVRLRNLELIAGNGVNGRAIFNHGNLTLHDIIIHDLQTSGSTIYNQGLLQIIGMTEIWDH